MKCSLASLFLLVCFGVCHAQAAKPGQSFVWDYHQVQRAKNSLARETKISPIDRTSLEQRLAKQYKDDPNPTKRAAETLVQLVDLNRDGAPEVIAQAVGDIMCSPTGNCHFWVFQKTSSGYRLILEKGAAQGFTVQPNRTSGYSDLVLNMHGSATEQGLYLYQFKQNRYQRTACYEANWTYLDTNDEVRELEEPRITPCKR
jgi:hypothetical protein